MSQTVAPEAPDILKGSLYALAAFFCMALFGIFTKLSLQSSSVFWVSFIAYLTGTLLLFPFIAQRGLADLKSECYPYLLGRALFGTAASFCYTIAIHYIPIVNGTLLFNTAPLFIPLLATLFLKDKIGKYTWIAVLLGFIGVIIIIKPTEAILTQPGNLIGLLSGIFLAIAYLLMKLLTRTDPGIRIIFYYLGIGTLLQIPLLFFVETQLSMEGVFYAILSGACILAAQMALVTGYKYAQASQIGIYQYSSVVFVGLIDWMIWGAIPSGGDLIGALLVAIAGIIVIRSGNHKKAVYEDPRKGSGLTY
jgi:drug/metabolite transporter (DMT)-like permease